MQNHYTKEEVVKKDFLFISYKHEDKDIVLEAIDFLFAAGVRLWYDADLVIGDKWNSIAEKLILHENCRGVIFFNSIHSFCSEPVYQERCFTLKKLERVQKTQAPFFVFPVNVGQTSPMLLLKEIFDSLPADDVQLRERIPLSYIETISRLFASETIYCYADPEDTNGYLTKLQENIARVVPGVIDRDALHMKALQEGKTEAAPEIRLGFCKSGLTDNVPSYLLKKDQAVQLDGTTYLVQDGQAYTVKPMVWHPLYCEQDIFFLLSDSFVDTRNAGPELQNWLDTQFCSLTFTEEEQALVRKVQLLTLKDMEKANTPEVFPAPEGWWIGDIAHGALQKAIRKDGTVFHSGYNFRTKKLGVRPVIAISKEDIASLTQKNL